jgi:uncharacterized membrane protein
VKVRRVTTVAYVFPPLTGLAVYLIGGSERERFHGLQAIALGLLAAISLYVASELSARITPFVFGFWVLAWVFLIVASLFGKDARLPLLGGLLRRAAVEDPRGTLGG